MRAGASNKIVFIPNIRLSVDLRQTNACFASYVHISVPVPLF